MLLSADASTVSFWLFSVMIPTAQAVSPFGSGPFSDII